MSLADFGFYNFEYTLDCIRESWEDFHKNPGKYEGREIDWAIEQTERIMHIQSAVSVSVLLKDEFERNVQLLDEFVSAHTKSIEEDQLKEPIVFNTEIEAEATNESIDEEIKLEVLGEDDPTYIKLDGKTASDIFKEELEAWGVKETSITYKCVMAISECCHDTSLSYNEVLCKVSNYIGINKGLVSATFSKLAKTADFSKTKYNPILQKEQHITKEFIVRQLLDFCE